MGYYEFFTRALQPGVHYVEVDPNNLCDDLVLKVRVLILLRARLAVQTTPTSLLQTASPNEQSAAEYG